MTWLARNSDTIQAGAAGVTALTAILAVAGVSLQLRAADAVSRAQSAREAYAAHLALAATQPRLAGPADACALLAGPDAAAYHAFVDHLLYSAEQMLDIEEGWDTTFVLALEAHATYLCSAYEPGGESPELSAVLAEFRSVTCAKTTPCPG